MPDPLQPLTPQGRRRRARRRACLGLTAWAVLAGGCLSPGANSAAALNNPSTSTITAADAPGAGGGVVTAEARAAADADTPSFWDHLNFARPPAAPPPPAETILLRADGIVPEQPPKPGSPEAQLAGARELFRQGQYVDAEGLFKYIADKKKTPLPVAEEARYYQAESLRLQGRLPKAADTYVDLLNKFPNTAYREQALRHMFDIADFWLKDSRERFAELKEKNEGKRWFVSPNFVHFEREKPLFDEEGRAIEKLEQVRYNEINGPLADQALFMAGSVQFLNENYKEADNYFSQIHEKHPNSPLAEKAVELAIIAKHLSTGGADYDGRKVAEARKLVQAAFDNYPELANKKKDFLARQLVGITLQQAEKDYKMAEFWKRTGHIGAAYFYFEMVQRRYPNTPFAELARKQSEELKVRAANDKNVLTGPPAAAQLGRPGPVQDETAPAPRRLDSGSDVPQPFRPQPPPETAPAPRPVPPAGQ
jgi:outer membrane protein assembly factor BamD (BamD/ComL family)